MKKIFITILILVFSMTTIYSFGQSYIMSRELNEVLIKGTSNLHDWQMVVSGSSCEANFIIEGDQLKGITKVDFMCKPTDIKSDHALMDKKTYSALKADVFPEIRFSFLSKNEMLSDSREFRGSLRGNLLVAGITKEVTVPFTATINADNTINVTGSLELKMSDFNITPPTALLGTLKTGDKISVYYSLILSGKTQISYR